MYAELLDFFSSPLALGIQALCFALLLVQFNRRHAKGYISLWALSWATFAIYHLTHSFDPRLSETSADLRILQAAVAATAGFLQVGWLVCGSFELARRRPVKLQHSKRLMLLLLALAAISTITPIAFDSASFSADLVRMAIHASALGVAAFVCAYLIWEKRARAEGSGFLLITGALGFLGLLQLFSSVALLSTAIDGTLSHGLPQLRLFQFAIQGVVGLSMLICMLDDEREAALRAASQVEHMAYHDPLTGLPNRGLFFDRLVIALAQATRHGYKVAVFFLDLDRFKEINDSLGHSAGDALLKIAAKRIRECVRQGDTVARFGGDEFTILVHIIGRIEDAGRIAVKVLDALREPFPLGDREIVVTSSIGIAIYPLDGSDAETLVRNADTAMYRAKQQGRDNYQLYTAAMNSRALENLDLENRLRKALKNKELVLYYQPLIDVEKETVFGFEALLRWNHPEQGLLLPDKFIPTAEISGLIVPIGAWVLQEACRQAKEWQERGLELAVSVNLSARQFADPELVQHVRAAMQAARLKPQYLEIEITESSAMQDVQASIRILHALKQLGVRISIDDFGTGYSSLSYLKDFPVDTLKLDQSFVRDITAPQDGAIASGIISLAHNLRLKVLAEGVETEGQLDFLKNNDCDGLQGFLFSVPLSPEAFERFLLRETAAAPRSPAVVS